MKHERNAAWDQCIGDGNPDRDRAQQHAQEDHDGHGFVLPHRFFAESRTDWPCFSALSSCWRSSNSVSSSVCLIPDQFHLGHLAGDRMHQFVKQDETGGDAKDDAHAVEQPHG